MTKVTNYRERKAIEIQIIEFGITPYQIFKEAHPKRFSSKIISMNFKSLQEDIQKEEKIDIPISSIKIDIINYQDSTRLNENDTSGLNKIKSFLIPQIKLQKKSYKHSLNYVKLNGYHFEEITSIDFIDNLIITASLDGTVKISEYNKINDLLSECNNNKNMKINSKSSFPIISINNYNKLILRKIQSPNISPLTKAKTINKSLVVLGDINGMIHIYNYNIGKHMTSSHSFTEEVFDFYNYSSNLLTISKDSFCSIYSLNSDIKTPIHTFRDLNAEIISSDFRIIDNFLIKADIKGNIVLKNVKDDDHIVRYKIEGEYGNAEIKYVKFNSVNENEYFICTEEGFKVFDIRTNKQIKENEFFYNTDYIVNDNSNYLVNYTTGIQHYTYSSSTEEFNLLDNLTTNNEVISCFQNNILVNHKFIDSNTNSYNCISAFGCENGDLFISY